MPHLVIRGAGHVGSALVKELLVDAAMPVGEGR